MKDFLQSLSTSERHELDSVQQSRQYQPSQVLFVQGEPSDGAYVVRQGEVELSLTVPGGAPVVVSRVGPGELLGEPALLQEARRSLGARAVGEVSVGFIDRRDFSGLRNTFRPVSFRLITEIARITARRMLASDRAATRAMGDLDEELKPPAPRLERPGASFDPKPFLPLFGFFEEFSAADFEELLGLCPLYEVSRGQPIVHRGEVSERCWIVVRGAVEAQNPHGERAALFGPGKAFGVIAPLLGVPNHADCLVRERGVVLEVEPATFALLTAPTSRLAFKFSNALALSLLQNLGRANRVLARAELRRRTLRYSGVPDAAEVMAAEVDAMVSSRAFFAEDVAAPFTRRS